MSSFRIVSHRVPSQHIREYPQATAESQEDLLYLAVKQYIPVDNPDPQPGDVTIVAAQACGFPKELFEPLWDDLICEAKQQGWRIRSIWAADMTIQGESGVINELLLGNEPNWHDHARDLLYMINLKREDMVPPIIGIGHSMGGNQLTSLALIHPRIFNALVLLDPIIQPQSAEVDPTRAGGPGLAQLSTFRRTLWPSRSAAEATFRKSPFYQSWDPRVLDKWIEYGLRETPTPLHPDARSPQVTLTTTPAQEVFGYLRENFQGYGVNGKRTNRATHADVDPDLRVLSPFYRAEAPAMWKRLPEVRPSVLYLFGAQSVTSNEEMNAAKVAKTGVGVGGSGGVQEGRVKGVTLEGVGHLVPMEAARRTAEEIASWVGAEAERWRSEMKARESWRRKRLEEKQELNSEWKRRMGEGWRTPKI